MQNVDCCASLAWVSCDGQVALRHTHVRNKARRRRGEVAVGSHGGNRTALLGKRTTSMKNDYKRDGAIHGQRGKRPDQVDTEKYGPGEKSRTTRNVESYD